MRGRTRYAEHGGLRTAYELRGRHRHRRRPWLVLVQGLGFDRYGWDPVIPGLARRFRLVLVDNRGSGRSTAATDSFTVADMARDVVAVLDAAGIKVAHVAGISLGGMVAQELAVDHPERVDRLVLAGTTPGWPVGHAMPQESMRLISATRGMTREQALRRHVQNALSVRTVAERPDVVDRLVAHQRSRPHDEHAFMTLASAGARYSGRLGWTRIRARTLVLHGTADTVVDPRNAKLLADRIPHAQLVLLPDLGHMFFWEDPDRFVRLVTDFLRAS